MFDYLHSWLNLVLIEKFKEKNYKDDIEKIY